MKSRFFDMAIIFMTLLVNGCAQTAAPSAMPTSSPMPPTVIPTETLPAGRLLPVRGLYVQFERRGWASEYLPGQMIQQFNMTDDVVGHTVREEVSLQLDEMKQMGVNTITFELRSADPPWTGSLPPCYIGDVLGLQYPTPTAVELENLADFFDLVQSKGMKIFLRLTNTHMGEQPPTNNALWLGGILNAIKDKPAFDLVLFEGAPRQIDDYGNPIGYTCGVAAEPPLWYGPGSIPAIYVQWAVQYGHSLGIPYRKLSAEAIVGDYYSFSQGVGGPEMTDQHQWDPVFTLKSVFDNLNIPEAERTYAISFYEHRKCLTAHQLPCEEADPHTWAVETATHIFDTIGRGQGARVVAPEMGLLTEPDKTWTTEMALASLTQIMQDFGIDGGCFWRWTDYENKEENDPNITEPIKKRGKGFVYNPVADVLKQIYTQGRVIDPKFDPAALATVAALTPEYQSNTPPNDSFDGSVLDTNKWQPDVTPGAKLEQDGQLTISIDGTQPSAGASIASNWLLPGDFDIQVDFKIGKGWAAPANGHLDGAFFAVKIHNQNYWITRLISPNQNGFMAFGSGGALTQATDTNVSSGSYRLVRTGDTLVLFYDIGKGWQQLSSATVLSDSAQVLMGSAGINASQAFTAYFDNFRVNSGITTYRP